MQVFNSYQRFRTSPAGSVLSIGNFDGVHRGHMEILRRAREIAERLGAQPTVMTFHPHPLAVLAPERAPAMLSTVREKLALLERAGIESCIVQSSGAELLGCEALDFLASLVAHCRPRAFVEGPDFHFGRARGGNVDTLRQYADCWSYEVHEVPTVHCAELRTHPTVSSASIRQALRDGRVTEAAAMLGRPHRIVGRVGSGAGRGVGLGFPTANLDNIAHLVPQEAVYAAVAQMRSGPLHLAAVNVGPQPTFDQPGLRVEAYLLDHEGDLRQQPLALHFLARLREQERFADEAALITQIQRDVAATREYADQLGKLKQSKLLAV